MAQLHLKTLGGISVEDSGRELGPAAGQPKRLALLVLIAGAGARGITRDRLLACLWPESDEARARNALNQAIHSLRRDLLTDVVVEGSMTLRLNPSIISTDFIQFRAALDRGELEPGLALYGGPFLDGFFVRDAPEFERWANEQRSQLQERARAAALALANRFAAEEDPRTAITWARRALTIAPHDEIAVRRLLELLRYTGDRAGAARAYEAFESHLAADLGVTPSPETQALFRSLKSDVDLPPGRAPSNPGDQTGEVDSWTIVRLPVNGSLRRRSAFAIATGGLALIAVLFGWLIHNSRVPAPLTPMSLAVLPFTVHGDSTVSFLGEGIARLVAQGLESVGPLLAALYTGTEPLLRNARSGSDTSEALTGRFRLDRYVTGDVTVLGASVQARATMYDASRRGLVLGAAALTAPRDSIFGLADALTRRLLGFEPVPGGGGLVKIASETTTSLTAFRDFVEAEAFFRASRYADAVAAYQRAVTEDTTFALAYYRLSEAADWNAQGGLIQPAAAAALRFADRLPWRERRLLEGSMAWRNGHDDEAESKFQQITSRYPNDAEAWFQLAEVLFHSNAIRGRLFLEARTPFERVLALDPANRGALTHLARIRAFEGDAQGADSLLRAAESLLATGPDAELALFRAVITGDAVAREAALARLPSEDTYILANVVHRLAAYARNLPMADTVVHRAIAAGMTVERSNFVYYWSAVLAAAQGQFGRALTDMHVLAETNPGAALELRGLLMTLPYSPYPERERAATLQAIRGVRRGSADPEFTSPARLGQIPRWYLLGLFAARARDTVAVNRYADSLRSISASPRGKSAALALAAALRAHRVALTGAPSSVVRELAGVPVEGDLRGVLIAVQLNERFLRATMLERLDRTEEALGYYGSLIFGDPASVLLAAPAALGRARLLVRMGRVREAKLDYETVLKTWQRADSPLQPVVDSARKELARLQ